MRIFIFKNSLRGNFENNFILLLKFFSFVAKLVSLKFSGIFNFLNFSSEILSITFNINRYVLPFSSFNSKSLSCWSLKSKIFSSIMLVKSSNPLGLLDFLG